MKTKKEKWDLLFDLVGRPDWPYFKGLLVATLVSSDLDVDYFFKNIRRINHNNRPTSSRRDGITKGNEMGKPISDEFKYQKSTNQGLLNSAPL